MPDNTSLNQSVTDEYEQYLLRMKHWNEVINCIIISVFIPFITGGNAMIILSLFKFKKLRTVMNLFVTSLSFADFLVGIPTIPFYIVFFISESILTNKYLCIIKYTFVLISLPGSILNLFIVTIDRFIAVVYPLHHLSIMTKDRAKKMISLVWVYSVGSAILPLLGVNTWDEYPLCDFWKILPTPYTMVVVPGTIIACLPAMICMYIKIFMEARMNKIRIRRFKPKDDSRGRKLKRDTKTAKMMAFVFLLFLLFWFPFFTASVLKYLNFHKLIIEMVKQCSVTLTMANSLVNPIIYCWIRPEFRIAFKAILCGKRETRNIDTANSSVCTSTQSSVNLSASMNYSSQPKGKRPVSTISNLPRPNKLEDAIYWVTQSFDVNDT